MDGMNTNFLFGIKTMGAVCSYCSPNTRLPTCARVDGNIKNGKKKFMGYGSMNSMNKRTNTLKTNNYE